MYCVSYYVIFLCLQLNGLVFLFIDELLCWHHLEGNCKERKYYQSK